MRCERGCRSFKDWTIEHFHADDKPAVVVYHTPEQDMSTLIMKEGWGVDAYGQTTYMPTADEAVSLAKRKYKALVTLDGRTSDTTESPLYGGKRRAGGIVSDSAITLPKPEKCGKPCYPDPLQARFGAPILPCTKPKGHRWWCDPIPVEPSSGC